MRYLRDHQVAFGGMTSRGHRVTPMHPILRLLAMALVLCALAPVASAQPVEPNIDRRGGDYASVTLPASSTASQCQALCAADPTRCKAWTYVRAGLQAANPRCWLKSTVPAPIASTCCTSGVMVVATPPNVGPSHVRPRIEENVDRRGGDYTSVTLPAGSTANNCRSLCAADPNRCRAWTYVKAGVQATNPRCWLKSTVPAAISSNCCTSGVMGRR